MYIRIARVVLVDGRGKYKRVLAVANMEFPPEDRWFGFPGGTVRVGEYVQKGAHREMREETGYQAGGLQLVHYENKKRGNGKQVGYYFFRASRYSGRMKKRPTKNKAGKLEDGPPQWLYIRDIERGKIPFHPQHIKVLKEIGEI